MPYEHFTGCLLVGGVGGGRSGGRLVTVGNWERIPALTGRPGMGDADDMRYDRYDKYET